MKITFILLLFLFSSYFLQAQSFTEVLKAVAADRNSSDQFGYAVSISGDYAVIGAYREDEDVNGSNTLGDAGSAYIFERSGGTWTQVQKITAPVRASEDEFGKTVSISNDYLIIGAPFEDEDSAELNTKTNAGSAYIYERNGATWDFVKKIVATDREADDRFGFTVSISGDYAIAGAPFEDENATDVDSLTKAGSVYIFKRNGGAWDQIQKIVATDRNSNDEFGSALDIDGDRLIVGVYKEDEDLSGSSTMGSAGSAYIYERNGATWSQTQKIVAGDRHSSDFFGFAVAIDGDYAVVGAYQNDYDENIMNFKLSAGAVYVFEHNGSTWGQAQKIVASDRNASDQFGQAVDISGNQLLIGAYGQDQDATGGNSVNSAGGAYVFEQNGSVWDEVDLLVASDRAISDNFSRYAVAIDGAYIMVGAYTEDEDAVGANTLASAGAAYIFEQPTAPTAQTYWYVDINAAGANNGLDWANAYQNLQAALDTAQTGDTIAIAQGNYLPSKNNMGVLTAGRDATFYINKDIVIQGGYQTGGTALNPILYQTILSGDLGVMSDASDNAYHVLWLENVDNTALLAGLVIQEGNANNLAYPNDRGAGIYNNGANAGNSSPILQNCIVRWNNAATMGGGLLNFANNSGTTSPSLRGCLFYENTSQEGASICNSTYLSGVNTMLIDNSTFVDNMGNSSIQNRHGNADVTIQNSIIWETGSNPISNYRVETTVKYSLINRVALGPKMIDGGNNIYNIDPQFVDQANDDYSLTFFSLALEKGLNALIPVGYNSDLNNNTRIIGPSVDLGAFETNNVGTGRIYVNLNATGANDGTSWLDAYTNLKTATDAALSGMEIWVAAGTYYPSLGTDRSASFDILNNVEIYGGFVGGETMLSQRNWAANMTILSGDIGITSDASDNSYHIISLKNVTNNTWIDGLVIEHGNSNASFPNDRGAGIYNDGGNTGNSSPTIQNCIVRWNNAGTMGGGLLNFANQNGTTSPIITGCLFYENTSTQGASIANSTYQSGSNSSLIINSTFADNVGGSSIYNLHGNATITIQNSILWDNSPIYNHANETTVQYSSIKGASLAAGTTDGGNNQLAMNPLFVDAANDDYSLQAASPAIASGNNAYLPAGYDLDLAHNTREIGTTVEMGCYEDGANLSRPALVQNEQNTNINIGSKEQNLEGGIEEEITEYFFAEEVVATMAAYPNPVQDVLNVHLQGIEKTTKLQLLNTTGQVVQQKILNLQEGETIQLDMSRLANGIYLLNLQLENGRQLNERIVKF